MMGTPNVPFLWSYHLHHHHLHNGGYTLNKGLMVSVSSDMFFSGRNKNIIGKGDKHFEIMKRILSVKILPV